MRHTKPTLTAITIGHLRLVATLTILILLLQATLAACNMPGMGQTPTTDPNAIRTSAAQTIQAGGPQQTAQAGQTAQALSVQQTNQAQAAQLTLTAQAPPPAATTPPAATEPPVPPAAGPTVSVSLDTNCRLGPSTAFDIISLLAVGQTTTVQGRLADNSWWYIADPRRAGQHCWLWGQYATVTGDIASIPVVASPPTPTFVAEAPGFQAAFSNLHACGNVDVAVFQVTNTSNVAFRSMRLILRDPLTTLTVGEESTNAPFMESGAACPPGLNSLGPGDFAFVASPLDDLIPSGAEVRAIITLCTDQELGGECVENRVVFEVP